MREINKIAESLFEKIRDRFEDVSLGDENAKATSDPEKARFFNFDYVADDKNYGNVTFSIIDEVSLKVYFSKNMSKDLSHEERDKWYAFLRELREFAKRNLLSFEPRDITRSTLKHRDIQQQSKADSTFDKNEVIGEGRMYGTSKSSYEDEGPVRIIVRHSDHVNPEQRGARARKIKAVFLETSDGERFKLPENNLRYARAMARHVSEGGSMTDDFGCHITEVANELSKLRPFKNSMRHRTFEDAETQAMIESAFEYHGLLNNTLKKMSGRKGYAACKENFQQNEQTIMDDFDVNALRERFVKRTFNDRLEDALPLVQKAYKMKKENKFAKQFESWANNVAESWDEDEDAQQWGAEPINVDDLVDIFADEIPVGVDAINATSILSGVIDNEDLNSKLLDLSQRGPEEDARNVIIEWLEENVPAVYQELMNEISDVEPADQNVDEGSYGDYGVDEGYEDSYDEDQVESIQSAIIRRILGNVSQHNELIKRAGPDGIMNAARDVASFHAPVEELGSSDISAMVREVYNEVGVEYPAVAEADSAPLRKTATPSKKAKDAKYYDYLARTLGEALESNAPNDSDSPLTHAHEEYCDACDSTECHCDELSEGKIKDIDIDLKELTDEEFQAKYSKTKEEMKAALSEDVRAGDDHVNKDVKMKRMGAKPLGMLDKLKGIKHGFDAARKGESEDELKLYNKQFKEDIEQMRRIAGLK